MGDEHYPLPWQSLKYDTDLGGYITGITLQQLEGAPRYSNDKHLELVRCCTGTVD